MAPAIKRGMVMACLEECEKNSFQNAPGRALRKAMVILKRVLAKTILRLEGRAGLRAWQRASRDSRSGYFSAWCCRLALRWRRLRPRLAGAAGRTPRSWSRPGAQAGSRHG